MLQIVRNKFRKIIKNLGGVFSELNESLPYNVNVVGTILTENNDPIHLKLCPYPIGVADFVNSL